MACLQLALPTRLYHVCPGDATVQGSQDCPSRLGVGDTQLKCLCYTAHPQAHPPARRWPGQCIRAETVLSGQENDLAAEPSLL